MTAINIFLQKTRAVVMTDALIIDTRTGQPVALRDKCTNAKGAGMVVLARGDWRVPAVIADDLADYYSNIDQFIADEGEAARNLYDEWVRSYEGGVICDDVEIMVVGWSPSLDRPCGAQIVKKGSWKFARIGKEGRAGPLPDDREMRRLRMIGAEPETHWDLETFDPVRHGIPYMEAQRRMTFPLGRNGPRIHVVGGWIMCTEITRDRIYQHVIHEWDDIDGMPIEVAPFVAPERSAGTPALPPGGLSRQQRRAVARVR